MNIIFDLIFYGVPQTGDTVMSAILYYFSTVTSVLFVVMYLHQLIYLIVGSCVHTKIKHPTPDDVKQHKIGVVISARNESKVISNLIDSIRANDYPQDLVTIFVIADNCTDDTAQICRDLGCVVVERFNDKLIGKGYALNYFFTKLHTEEEFADLVPEAYIIIDADNILKPNYITEMNKAYDAGNDMVTSYRNTKNFSQSWVAAGTGYWFLHETRHLNNCRYLFHTSCAISGTGFLIATNVVKEFDNWKFFTLTEDIECSTEYALTGRKVAYCSTAELYDEQPITLKQSWRQRERWAKGFYQVFGLKGWSLVKAGLTNFSCWDILTTIFPALFITMASLIVIPTCMIVSACMQDWYSFFEALKALGGVFVPMLGLMWVVGGLICITEWKKILANPFKKILYLLLFPIFMGTYIPISIGAMFRKVQWKPIEHTAAITMEELQEEEKLQELSLDDQIKLMKKEGEKNADVAKDAQSDGENADVVDTPNERDSA